MKIAVDLCNYTSTRGFGRYVRGLWSEIYEFNCLGILPEELNALGETIIVKKGKVPLYRREIKLQKLTEIDCIHYTDNSISFRNKIPSIVTLHDISPILFQEIGLTNWKNRNYFKFLYSQIAKKSLKIITVSETSRKDIIERLQVSPEKVIAIYNGISSYSGEYLKLSELKSIYSITKPFVFYVGGLDARKNLKNMISGFNIFNKQKEFQFVIAGGGKSSFGIDYLDKNKLVSEDIVFIGEISDFHLQSFYKHCEGLMFATVYEGFGFPVLEAALAGKNSLVSKGSACEEILGQYAISAYWNDVGSIAEGIRNVIDLNFNDDLINHADSFTWKRCAEETYQVYRESISS